MSVEFLSVSWIGFSSFLLTLSIIILTLSGGFHFIRRFCRPCPIQFVGVGGSKDLGSYCMGSDDSVFRGRRGTIIVADITLVLNNRIRIFLDCHLTKAVFAHNFL